jgi:acetyl-CoA acetyltransferase
MSRKVLVAGVGMTPFVKPAPGVSYIDLGVAALRDALADAGVGYGQVQQAYAGYVYGDSTSGQAVLYHAGLTGIPVVNVNNNCSTGSSALFLARQAIESGVAECVVAIGFEQMMRGALGNVFDDRVSPLQRFLDVADAQLPESAGAPMAIRLFGGAGHEYQQKYGMSTEAFAKVRVKASRHAVHNPRAIFRQELTVGDVLQSEPILPPLTRLQCCPPTCGGAAAILCSEDFARRHALRRDVRISAQAMTTDFESSFQQSMISAVGADMTRAAAQAVYDAAGVDPRDLDVVELHDCFTTNEVITYEGLMLCPEGGAERFIEDGDNSYGGQVVTNPSGGLLSKGHPLGATGLGQCAELVWQLRGEAGARQVPDARLALQHNLGLGGACVVTLYEKA